MSDPSGGVSLVDTILGVSRWGVVCWAQLQDAH